MFCGGSLLCASQRKQRSTSLSSALRVCVSAVSFILPVRGANYFCFAGMFCGDLSLSLHSEAY